MAIDTSAMGGISKYIPFGSADESTVAKVLSVTQKVATVATAALACYYRPLAFAFGALLGATIDSASEFNMPTLTPREHARDIIVNGIMTGLMLSSGGCYGWFAGMVGVISAPIAIHHVSRVA